MGKIYLKPDYFLDDKNEVNLNYLSIYGKSSENNIIYLGNINCRKIYNISLNNIVQADDIYSVNIARNLPDLISAKNVRILCCDFLAYNYKIDIGKLKEVNSFGISYAYINPHHHISYLKKIISDNFKIIDENNLIVNGKHLHVRERWSFYNKINFNNFHRYGLKNLLLN